MPLTDLAIRKLKPASKLLRHYDSAGLYLEVSPSGGRWWRLKYRFAEKEKRLSLGTYPEVGLAEARERRDAARKLVKAGIDPSLQRKSERAATLIHSGNTFAAIAEEFSVQRASKLAEGTAIREKRLIEKDLNPYIGNIPIQQITAPLLLKALRKIEERGAVETSHRARTLAGQIFRYAIATGRATSNPAPDLIGALKQPQEHHFASITNPVEVAGLLRAMYSYSGAAVTISALRLAPLVFIRPGELRNAKWADVDLQNREWRFAASKTGQAHLVPLSRQAFEILSELRPLTGRGELVFPTSADPSRPMSENTITAALRRMGYDRNTMTGHGFRAMARTILDEGLGFRPDYIEHQLAHKVKDPNGRAYNRTAHLAERRVMMQTWSDYLDWLRTAPPGTDLKTVPSNLRPKGDR